MVPYLKSGLRDVVNMKHSKKLEIVLSCIQLCYSVGLNTMFYHND